jgi:hypothetical protein
MGPRPKAPGEADLPHTHPESQMRLPNIPSNQVTTDQRPLFDKLNTGIRENLQGFTTQKPDGSLIGPFSALLHFPGYGTPVWDLFLMWWTVPAPCNEVP